MLPPDDARTLNDLVECAHTRFFLSCEKCGRTSNHSLTSFIARFGGGRGITDLLAELSRDCPQRAEAGIERCGVAYQLIGNSSRKPDLRKKRPAPTPGRNRTRTAAPEGDGG
jgi:hypothetical protein